MKITTTLLKQIIKEEMASLAESNWDRSDTRSTISGKYDTEAAAKAALAKAEKNDPNHFENRKYEVASKTTTVYEIVKK